MNTPDLRPMHSFPLEDTNYDGGMLSVLNSFSSRQPGEPSLAKEVTDF